MRGRDYNWAEESDLIGMAASEWVMYCNRRIADSMGRTGRHHSEVVRAYSYIRALKERRAA